MHRRKDAVGLSALVLPLVLVAAWLVLPARARGQEMGQAPTGPAGAAMPALELETPSAVLMDVRSGAVLFAKGAHERRHPASVTKIMTLLVAYDALAEGRIRLTDEVVTSEEASRLGGTTAFLEAGEPQPVSQLLRAIAVGSANDAAVAIAERVAGSHQGFVALMNARARELGLQNTHFANATGFDAPDHYTSAYDVAVMSRHLVQTYPEVLKLTKIFLDYMDHPDGRRTELLNRNRLVRFYDWVDGLKTGWTNLSGYSIAATGMRDGTRLIAVLLGSPSARVRQAEALKLLEYGFANYRTVALAAAGTELGRVPVARGAEASVAAVPREDLAVTLPRSQRKRPELRVSLVERIKAPVSRGQVLGTATAVLDGQEVARVELVARDPVPRITAWEAVRRAFGAVFFLR
ncbi:D-alanyl-D-alanine carboxypeptidase family protein [Caldinitratiruptor microaerophilus]|uniref:serine-type D-Ala-D-Ala carboxypeptidase n=1 Tax=Caldinitratiruptor microaerophilus TaxID=671077 RepID=A0AA35CIQ9_9FIRM|nr:D-alanyl-D-alanine carboxypeptidase family protein [Caldinitratiruptor microaerophilus]BDG59954.1 D-Ala-D-Ala carboxypeptidase [Caldinitratiruptor microaerophilus]